VTNYEHTTPLILGILLDHPCRRRFEQRKTPCPPGWGTGVRLTSSAPKNSSVLTSQQWGGHDPKKGLSAIQGGEGGGGGGGVLLYVC